MFDSWNQSRAAAVAKALVVLVSATGCLAAVAYAASSPSPVERVDIHARPANGAKVAPRPPRPRLTRHPGKTTLSTRVSFRYVDRRTEVSFQCKLDDAGWKPCGPRVAYRGLAVGPHRFLVRAEAEGGARSLPARYAWVQMEPKSFSIAAELSGLAQLFPGADPVPLPLVLTNPNTAPISVTGLRVAVNGDAAACPSAENLELIQAGVSEKTPLKIPAGGTVRLPAPGFSAPAIALRNLPVNQDACQGAQFPLVFSGEARG